MDDYMVEPAQKQEIKIEAKKSKEDDEKQSKMQKGEKNKQLELYQQLMDPKLQEDCDISLHTGCTAVVCLINENNNRCYFANAGDSRVILCKNGIAYPMSMDHKPDLDTEKNRIYKADGWVSEGRVKGKDFMFN